MSEDRVPMPHQLEAVEYAKNRKNIALFMEMRLGKTWSLILAVQQWCDMGEVLNHNLVVAPVSVLRSWQQELNICDEQSFLLSSMSKQDRVDWLRYALSLNHRVWVLASYETLLGTPELLEDVWDTVSLDESTKIKNPKAQITKLCTKHFRKAKHRAILTGLPTPENILDYFEQFRFLSGSFMDCDNYWQFRAKNFLPTPQKSWVPKLGVRPLMKARAHLRSFTRTRNECNIGSKKIFTTRTVPMNAQQKRLTDEMYSTFGFTTASGGEKETEYAMVVFSWLSSVAGGHYPKEGGEPGECISDAKFKEIHRMIEGELKGEPLVIWFNYNTELYNFHDFLKEKGIVSRTITGEDSPQKRHENRIAFNNGEFDYLLCQEACGKYGLDCSRADVAIYYSNSMSCEKRAQSEDRIVHPTKKRPLLYIDLVTEGSIDEDIVPRIQQKTLDARWVMSRVGERLNGGKNKTG